MATAVAVGEVDGRPVAVFGDRDGTLRVWDVAVGAAVGEPFTGHERAVAKVAVGEVDGRPVAVSGAWDGTLRAWDLAAGAAVGERRRHRLLGAWQQRLRQRLERRRRRRRRRLLGAWRPAGHDGKVGAVALGRLDGHSVMVSSGDDSTVRVWDLAGSQLAVDHVGSPVRAVAVQGGSVVVGASAGVMALRLAARRD